MNENFIKKNNLNLSICIKNALLYFSDFFSVSGKAFPFEIVSGFFLHLFSLLCFIKIM